MNISRQIYEFIVDEYQRWGYVPNQTIIRKFFARMTENADLHLRRLANEGLIGLGTGDDNSILLLPSYADVRRIPLRNSLAVSPINVDPAFPEAAIAVNLRGAGITMPGEYHAEVVPDDSMVDAGLMQGDIAIMLEMPPSRGDIVTVEVQGKVLFRRYVTLSTIPHLLAENPLRPDLIPAWECGFSGVLWGLIRATPRPLPLASFQKVAVDYTTAEKQGSSEVDNPTRGAHLLMDKEGWKQAISSSQAAGQRTKAKSERVPSPKKNKKRKLPPPPPVIGLNDQNTSVYRSAKEELILDERPNKKYHQDSMDEIEAFTKLVRSLRDPGEY